MMAAKAKKPYEVPEPGDLSDTALFGAIRDAKIKMDEALRLERHYVEYRVAQEEAAKLLDVEINRRCASVASPGQED